MSDGSEISGPGDKRESGGNRAERRTCAGSVIACEAARGNHVLGPRTRAGGTGPRSEGVK